MMHGEMHGLICPYGMHCIWNMVLTCNGTFHIHGSIAYHGCECMVENQHYVWCLIGWARYRVARLNEMVKKTCVG